MNLHKFRQWIGPAILLGVLCGPLSAAEKIVLNEEEYFEGPGFSFLLFHNNYQVGFQGGLQMIQNGERLLDSGDLLLVPKGDEGSPAQHVVRREVNREKATATIYGEIEGWNSGYQLICRTDGERILVTLKLDRPIDWNILLSVISGRLGERRVPAPVQRQGDLDRTHEDPSSGPGGPASQLRHVAVRWPALPG